MPGRVHSVWFRQTDYHSVFLFSSDGPGSEHLIEDITQVFSYD